MSVAIVQGASGGIGQLLTARLLADTSLKVYALTHRSASEAKDLKSRLSSSQGHGAEDRLTVVDSVDLVEEETLGKAAELIKSREGEGQVRLIACLAGVLHPEKSLSAITTADSLRAFQINTLGHLYTYKHFVPLVPTRKQFNDLSKSWTEGGGGGGGDPAKGVIGGDNSLCWSMSARVGSIGDNNKGGWYSYRASKAALNQVIRTLDLELLNKKSSALAIAYHPGTTLTSFTRPIIGDKVKPNPEKGLLSPDQAVDKMVGLMGRVNRDEGWAGGFWDYNGDKVEW